MQYKNMHKKSKNRAFTLIELLIVIAIIAIIAAVVFVALDPLTRFQDARDSQRWSDVGAILSAVKVDQVDNGGNYFTDLQSAASSTYYQIGTAASGCDSGCTAQTTAAACLDLAELVTEGYIGSVPFDPSSGAASSTDYYLYKASTGILEVGACDPENATTISISR